MVKVNVVVKVETGTEWSPDAGVERVKTLTARLLEELNATRGFSAFGDVNAEEPAKAPAESSSSPPS